MPQGVDSVSNRNGIMAVGDIVMKSGIFKFLEPCGPLQACNGTAVPFTVITQRTVTWLWSNITCLIEHLQVLHNTLLTLSNTAAI